VNRYDQFGIEAQIPINRASGSYAGILVLAHIFFDDVAPKASLCSIERKANMTKLQTTWRRLATHLAVFGGASVITGSAFAHVFPQKQEPGAGATVPSPMQVSIRFDGPLEPVFSSLTVTDATGKQVNTAKASVDPQRPAVIFVPLPPLATGRYTVHWAAVSADAHRTHGDYTFNIK
jgi:methionine-rich copper-binding protein CopC